MQTMSLFIYFSICETYSTLSPSCILNPLWIIICQHQVCEQKRKSGGRCDEKTPFLPPQLGGFIPVTKDWRAESGFSSRPPI